MPTVRTGLTSSFPRSEELVAASREFDRGRRSAEDLRALYAAWTDRVISLEKKLGFSTVTGGDLPRQDLFRPFSESTRGLEVGPLTRWFETNTFYRQPIVHAPPQWAPGAFQRHLPLERLVRAGPTPRAILPGPYTFSALADNRTELSREELARRWSELLALEVHDLAAHGVKAIQLQEPSLAVDPPSVEEEAWVRRAYEPLAPALAPVESVLWTFFGDGAAVLPLLASLPVKVVGVDLADTDPGHLRELSSSKGLGLGCLDSRTTLVEDPKEVARLVQELGSRLKPSEILLGPGAPLELVPWEVAERKLSVLPEVRRLLGDERGGPRKVSLARASSSGRPRATPKTTARSAPRGRARPKVSSKSQKAGGRR